MRGQQTGFCHLNYISGPAAMSLVQCQKCALVYASLTPAPHAIVCVEIALNAGMASNCMREALSGK